MEILLVNTPEYGKIKIMTGQSLSKRNSKYGYVSILLVSSLLFLLLGLFLPAIHLKEIVFFQSTFSVLTGIQNLFIEGHILLGLLIVLFSILFPIFKLLILFRVWFSCMPESKQIFYIRWLEIFGKWSMLDVFVVAITVVMTQISKLADANPRIGIYFFCASILITMIVTEIIGKILHQKQPEQ